MSRFPWSRFLWSRFPCFALFFVVAGLLVWSSDGLSQGKKGKKPDGGKKGTELFKFDGKLTADDAKDTVRKGCHRKLHDVRLEPGNYVIDLVSDDFDAYLRVEDAKGFEVAKDDDKAGDFNARIMFKVGSPDPVEYRLVVTTYSRGETGKYRLTVSAQKDKK